VIEEK